MKKLFLLISYILMCNIVFGQPKAKEYFLERSKNQKTTGWVLLGAGTAAIVTGVLLDEANRGSSNQSYTGGFFILGGFVGTLTSIPFFIGSSKNKKRATTLTVSNQRMLFPREDLIVLATLPTITVKISLNR